ncbi:hypothetical protein BB561_007007, partial [Smittium simulii]
MFRFLSKIRLKKPFATFPDTFLPVTAQPTLINNHTFILNKMAHFYGVRVGRTVGIFNSWQ